MAQKCLHLLKKNIEFSRETKEIKESIWYEPIMHIYGPRYGPFSS